MSTSSSRFSPRQCAFRRALVLAIALSLPPLVTARPAAGVDPRLAGLDDYVATAVAEWQVPGLAIAVVADGEVVFERGYGVRTLGRTEPVDEHTLFAVGSTTKAMTGAAVALLVEEGKLGWEDRVVDHLPWFRVADPWVSRELRVRDLLTHVGGLPNTDFLWYEQDTPAREIVERLRFVEPTSSLRSDFVYQNVMYAAAGQLIEAVSGESWARFVDRRLFEPLGMTRTVPLLAETARRDNVATPHDRIDGQLVPIRNASVDNVAAAGSVWSSVHEMAQWSRLLLAGGTLPDGTQLLSESALEALFRPWALVEDEDFYPTARLTSPHWRTYGLAWFQADWEGRRVDFHTGSIDGMVAIHGLLRDEGIGVVVLANRDHAELRHALMYYVFDLFDDDPPRDWSREMRSLYAGIEREGERRRAAFEEERVGGTAPSRPLSELVGRYQDPLYGRVEVVAEGDGLALVYGRRRARLEHWHYDTFLAPWESRWRGRGIVTFHFGSDGGVRSLELDGMELSRVEPQD